MEHLGIERLAAQLEKFKPTVLHCLCESRAGLARQLSRMLDLPYVLMINSLAKRMHKLSDLDPSLRQDCRAGRDHPRQCGQALPRFAERIAQIHIGAFVETDTICFTEPIAAAEHRCGSSVAPGVRFRELLRGDQIAADGQS